MLRQYSTALCHRVPPFIALVFIIYGMIVLSGMIVTPVFWGKGAKGKESKYIKKENAAIINKISYPYLSINNNILFKRKTKLYRTYEETLGNATRTYTKKQYNLIMRVYSLGLGNRMFAYASSYGLAKETNRIFVYHSFSNILTNSFGITHLPQREINCSSCVEFCTTKCCVFQEELYRLPEEDIILSGFMQSWKYFIKYDDEIRKQFIFKSNIRNKAMEFLNTVNAKKKFRIVGVHIRRGDMMNIKNKNYGHTVADVEYLNRAIAYFKNKYSCVFVVSSNDLQWSENALKHYANNTVYTRGNSATLDLAILSMCDHVIMTVGTFGWWAGYLSGGEVIYYKNWPKIGSTFDSTIAKEDYFPRSWIGL